MKIADWTEKELADANYNMNKEYFKTGEHKKYESFFKLKEAFEIILKLNNKRPLTCLEIGCGSGWQIRYLCEEGITNNLEYTGTDISKHMIDYAKNNFPNGTYIVNDIVSKYPEKRFDIVFDAATIQLVSDWRLGLKNMIKCSNEWIILHRLFYTNKESYTEQNITYNNIPDLRHYINLNELETIFDSNGFCATLKDYWRKDMGTFMFRRKDKTL